MTLNKEREEYNLVSYKELEKIFIQCEKNSQLNKEFSIDKNIEINDLNQIINNMNLKIEETNESLQVCNKGFALYLLFLPKFSFFRPSWIKA